MKRIIMPALGLLALSFIYILSASDPRPNFVYLEHQKLCLNGKQFYPLVLNYQVSLQADRKGIWASPYPDYLNTYGRPFRTKDSCLAQLKTDMEFIKEMGFNTVRIVGIGEEEVNKKTGEISLKSLVADGHDSIISFSEENQKKYFDALGELLSIVNQSGLKTILLTRMIPGIESCDAHLLKMADRFRHDSSLIAYDLFNEPLYFDTLPREKKDVFHITKKWKHEFKKHSPDQLLTIGLVGVREIFEWDPNAMNVDFISFHPYEFEENQVKNEMFWFASHVKKPWIIGETGIPADNDSVSYETQKRFAQSTLDYANECGAIGYSWWQYKDVNWKTYYASYLGVVSQEGKSLTKTGGMIHGTAKPVTDVFRQFRISEQKKKAEQISNYYNYSHFSKYKMKGKLVDQNNQPLAGGVVQVWDTTWTKSFTTISKADGSFELFTDEPMCHIIYSASLHTATKGDFKPEEAQVLQDGSRSFDFGTIQLWEVYF